MLVLDRDLEPGEVPGGEEDDRGGAGDGLGAAEAAIGMAAKMTAATTATSAWLRRLESPNAFTAASSRSPDGRLYCRVVGLTTLAPPVGAARAPGRPRERVSRQQAALVRGRTLRR